MDLIDVFFDKETIDIASVFCSYIPQRVEAVKNKQSQQPGTQGINKWIDNIDVIVKTLKIRCNNISVELHDLSLSYNNGIIVSFSSLTSSHKDSQIIDFGSSSVKISLPEESRKLATFADFPRDLNEALLYNFERKKGRTNEIDVKLGSLDVRLSEDLLKSVAEIIEWTVPLSSLISEIQNKKAAKYVQTLGSQQSHLIRLKSPLMRLSCLGYVCSIQELNISLMHSSKNLWNAFRSIGSAKSLTLSSPISPDFNLIQNTISPLKTDPNFLFFSFEYKTVIGKTPTFFGNLLSDLILLRIPVDFDFVNDFIRLFSVFSSKEEHETQQKAPFDALIDLNFNSQLCVRFPIWFYLSHRNRSISSSTSDQCQCQHFHQISLLMSLLLSSTLSLIHQSSEYLHISGFGSIFTLTTSN